MASTAFRPVEKSTQQTPATTTPRTPDGVAQHKCDTDRLAKNHETELERLSQDHEREDEAVHWSKASSTNTARGGARQTSTNSTAADTYLARAENWDLSHNGNVRHGLAQPRRPQFHPSLGKIERLLGSSSKWLVAQFATPNTIKDTTDLSSIVVKVANGVHQFSHVQELKVLRHLRRVGAQSSPPDSLPRLVWDPEQNEDVEEYWFGGVCNGKERIQFGITPSGKPFNLGAFETGLEWSQAIESLVDGLGWLHKEARVVHRDIRPVNIVLHGHTAVIIDFDCAFFLPSTDGTETPVTTVYEGGIICVPTRVLRAAIEQVERGRDGRIQNVYYTPEPQDDLCAFVLLMWQLLFPSRSWFPFWRITEGQAWRQMIELETFQSGLANNLFWGRYWRGAQDQNYNVLKGLNPKA